MKILRDLGLRLAAWRERAKLKRTQVSENINRVPNFWGMVEGARSSVSLDVFRAGLLAIRASPHERAEARIMFAAAGIPDDEVRDIMLRWLDSPAIIGKIAAGERLATPDPGRSGAPAGGSRGRRKLAS